MWPSEVVLLLTSFFVSVLCADFRNAIGFFLSRKGTVLQLSYVFNIMSDFSPLQSTYFHTTLKNAPYKQLEETVKVLTEQGLVLHSDRSVCDIG